MKEEIAQNIPHFDIIEKDGQIRIPSIFMFDKMQDLFTFLHGCEQMNCTVVFDNEDIEVKPESDPYKSLLLAIYSHIAEHPKIVSDYVRYLANKDKMTWNK